MYRFARLENEHIKTYSFKNENEARCWINSEIEEFKRINNVTDMSKDRSFIKFKNELEQSLETQKERNDLIKCEKCTPSDHEGVFCRCESRNIRIAKKIRGKK